MSKLDKLRDEFLDALAMWYWANPNLPASEVVHKQARAVVDANPIYIRGGEEPLNETEREEFKRPLRLENSYGQAVDSQEYTLQVLREERERVRCEVAEIRHCVYVLRCTTDIEKAAKALYYCCDRLEGKA